MMGSNIQLIRIGSDIVRNYYQNKQFNELSKQYHHISSQNQSLLNTIQAYRKIDFVDKFHAAMTLMEEAFHSQNESVFHHNVHSANERFTEIICMQQPEGIEDFIYTNIIVGSYFGKFQYYAVFDDIPNMMKQFFECGTKYPLHTMTCFGEAFPKLFLNERFFAYLQVLPEGDRIVARTLADMQRYRYEDAIKPLFNFVFTLRGRAESMLKEIDIMDIAAQAISPYDNLYDALVYMANNPRSQEKFVDFLNNVKKLRKKVMFSEEDKMFPAVCLYAAMIQMPILNKEVTNYMKIKEALLSYYREGLKELGGG